MGGLDLKKSPVTFRFRDELGAALQLYSSCSRTAGAGDRVERHQPLRLEQRSGGSDGPPTLAYIASNRPLIQARFCAAALPLIGESPIG